MLSFLSFMYAFSTIYHTNISLLQIELFVTE